MPRNARCMLKNGCIDVVVGINIDAPGPLEDLASSRDWARSKQTATKAAPIR